jgi:hypothetical protein
MINGNTTANRTAKYDNGTLLIMISISIIVQ